MKNEQMNIFLCEFSDKTLEQDFLNYEIKNAKKYLIFVVFGVAVFYTLFAIPDLMLLKNTLSFRLILSSRFLYFAIIVTFGCFIPKIKSGKIMSVWISVFEIISSVFLILNLSFYINPDLLIQSYGIMLFIIIVFLVPNRLIYIVIINSLTVICFSVFSYYKIENIEIHKFLASVVYNFLAIILSCIYSYRGGYIRRKQYLTNIELKFLTYCDPLTGLNNKLKMNKEIDRLLKIAKNNKSVFSVILFDIDDFKIINDTYGHMEGDRIITELGTILHEMAGRDYIGVRWGGEEFVVIMPNKNSSQAAIFAEELRKEIENHTFNKDINLTCSFGVAESERNDTVESIITRADNLLYNAKKFGKNIVVA